MGPCQPSAGGLSDGPLVGDSPATSGCGVCRGLSTSPVATCTKPWLPRSRRLRTPYSMVNTVPIGRARGAPAAEQARPDPKRAASYPRRAAHVTFHRTLKFDGPGGCADGCREARTRLVTSGCGSFAMATCAPKAATLSSVSAAMANPRHGRRTCGTFLILSRASRIIHPSCRLE